MTTPTRFDQHVEWDIGAVHGTDRFLCLLWSQQERRADAVESDAFGHDEKVIGSWPAQEEKVAQSIADALAQIWKTYVTLNF